MMRTRFSRRALSTAASSAKASVAKKEKHLFDKILIANRGEISCRVSRTAHKLGIKTVAIYSDPDANALHVQSADEAVCVGPAPSSKSYLNTARILDAVTKTGSQAVHPGYGFLSENAGFARTLESAGVKFIGPRSHSIEAMGDKIESKQLAIKAGVNTIPGVLASVPTPDEAVKIARDIGYPVMIKASAGGGGKGMRIAWNDDEVRMGYRLSKEEAKSSFGNDSLFVEKFIEDPRHIEIQLIADAHGNVVALPERECSIQRRNQKVIEESPSVLLDEKTRRAMQEQACMLAKAVGYESAGTVEFLADKHRNFYFLEMNTRLQVEHPVTEMITGVDLVELMIRVAAGEKLPSHLTGAPVPILGHAFESRVYAEDPFRGFLPSTGRLSKYAEPPTFADRDPYLSEEIRCDAGVQEGSEISMFYDPMICKLVTHGASRDDALDRMRAALDSYVIRGVGHNVSFLRDLTDHKRFVEGRLTTQFIKEEYPDGFSGVKLSDDHKNNLVAVAAVMHAMQTFSAADVADRSPAVAMPDVTKLVVSIGVPKVGKPALEYEVRLTIEPGANAEDALTWIVTVTKRGSTHPVVIKLGGVDWSADAPLFLANLQSAVAPKWHSEHMVRVQQLARLADGFRLQYAGALEEVRVRTPRAQELSRHMLPKPERDTSRILASPMPGTLVSVAVKPGDKVEIGQELAVVEAMKMQNVLRSQRRGTVKTVASKAGSTLAVDQVIIEFE